MATLKTYYLTGGEICKMSLVEFPAVEVDFECFARQAQEHANGEKMRFAKTMEQMVFYNEEKRIITGVAMLADTPIYRNNPILGEHNVAFSAALIEQLEHEFMKHANDVNLEHATDTNGIHIIESFLVSDHIKCSLFPDVPNGSWIVSYKVDDENLWTRIKNREFNGFSIEGIFEYPETINNTFNNQKNEEKFMKKMSLFMARIARALMKMAEMLTIDGRTLIYEGEMAVGTDVFIEDTENGEMQPAPDGMYETDTLIITVADGVVTEIRSKEQDAEDENPEDTEDENAPDYAAAIEMLVAKVAELESRLSAVESKVIESNPDEQFKKRDKSTSESWDRLGKK